MQFHTFVRRFAISAAVIIIGTFGLHSQAKASGGAPAQSDCDNGSTSLTWASLGIARPVVASLSVDGETITDPANPALNNIGAVVCPGTALGARTGLSIYYHTDSSNSLDLTGALTPLGNPITASSKISITMINLGDNAKYFTFALVHGEVSNWTTNNLGTADASVSFTFSPVRTPELTSDDAGGCTATPPDCHALKSDADVLSAGLDMSFDRNGGGNMAGSYFALTGAMGGFVTPGTSTDGSKTLVASLGAPHFLADGTTLNTGSMTAFLPTAVVASLFGLTGTDLDTTTLDVLRTSGTTTSSAIPFTVQSVTGGITLTVPTITFSSPKYTIKMTAAGLAKQKLIAVTPYAKKSIVKVVGVKIKANGKSTYRLEITVKNKLGKVLKIVPVVTSAPASIIGKASFKSPVYSVKISTSHKGLKTIKVYAKKILLKTLTLKFLAA